MDWLRIGAFLLLIVYHIGLYFSPWDWHVNAAPPVPWVVYILHLLNPWRMTLLFVVSGYASRALLSRSPSPGGFAVARSKRLLIPLLFGVCVLVVPQPWIEARVKDGYQHGFFWFWIHQYFNFDPSDGIDTPAFDHLWFVAYIWVYSIVVAAGARFLPAPRATALQALAERWLSGWRLIVLPILWILFWRLVVCGGGIPSNRVLTDYQGHPLYLPAFLFGFALARSEALWPSILRCWRIAAGIAAIAYLGLLWSDAGYPGVRLPEEAGRQLGFAFAICMQWTMVVALLGFAEIHLNRDDRIRATLTEAVFPVYIIHQTVIVAMGWWLLLHPMPVAAQIVVLLATTCGACWLFYLVGRSIPWLRPLIGLGPIARGAR
ncbi:acyltransferase family protein [Flavisphingomonas formosensis]|uniref:acyltransferase family protein n=1 Tax=Flavisphingomonas formosensis TaxID=861534 RepID=UPI0012FC17C1|nr:acyltransferase family protein [Sphingomonas formosensis]